MLNDTAKSSRALARKLRLRYVQDLERGIARRKRGKGFEYVAAGGRRMRNSKVLARIKSLVIPPAWTDVRICRYENGHLQVVGKDARGRKQYRYHPRWTAARSVDKFARMLAFGHELPRIRRRIARDLRKRDLSREKVLGAVVRLLEASLIRVGNDEYARSNNSYGLTTLRDKHVRVNGHSVHFRFNGKSGQKHRLEVKDKKLAHVIKHCKRLPGEEVFEYVDRSGNHHDVTSQEVNAYLQEITDEKFTAKDFRTWAGTVMAIGLLQKADEADSERAAKRQVSQTVKKIAEKLGNTPAVCRSSYIHPGVIDAYCTGKLRKACAGRSQHGRGTTGLRKPEIVAMQCLKRLEGSSGRARAFR